MSCSYIGIIDWLCAHLGGVHCSGSGPLSKNMSFEFEFTKNIN
jgi:hypothetical protein